MRVISGCAFEGVSRRDPWAERRRPLPDAASFSLRRVYTEQKGGGRANLLPPGAETPSCPAPPRRCSRLSGPPCCPPPPWARASFRVHGSNKPHSYTKKGFVVYLEFKFSLGILSFILVFTKFGNPNVFLCETGRHRSHGRVRGRQAGGYRHTWLPGQAMQRSKPGREGTQPPNPGWAGV